MGFLDKAKEKAAELAGQAKDKYEDVQGRRKADDLLDDLGRISYGQHTGRPHPNAAAETERLVTALQALEASGVDVLEAKSPPADGGSTPMPPPAPPAPPAAP
jgi:hypothetical protein